MLVQNERSWCVQSKVVVAGVELLVDQALLIDNRGIAKRLPQQVHSWNERRFKYERNPLERIEGVSGEEGRRYVNGGKVRFSGGTRSP
ncbi:MAG: hypothetical protein KC917_23770, partial [Candidatus Omnitrophica bacterium]|nr:hypothetical protein [Candidatus Omnitrophota bacterium]